MILVRCGPRQTFNARDKHGAFFYHSVYNNKGDVKGRGVRPRLPEQESATLFSLELLLHFETKTLATSI